MTDIYHLATATCLLFWLLRDTMALVYLFERVDKDA